MDTKRCPHCNEELNDNEIFVGVCRSCRRYGLIHGKWPINPDNQKGDDMKFL